jgi:hypothetical protein
MTHQAAEQHEKLTTSSFNNMKQRKENVQKVVSNKTQELHNVTEKWKDSCKRALKIMHEKQGKQFEKKCHETQHGENEKAAKLQANQERMPGECFESKSLSKSCF